MARSTMTGISTTRTMRRLIRERRVNRYLALGLAVAACSQQQPGNEVDIGDAARAARASSANYVDETPPPAQTSIPTPAAAPTPTPTAAPVAAATPAIAPDSAQAAATVVETYFALIEQGKYARARQLWDRDGAASGMTPEAFATSFDKYADYHAEVGTPGRVDSGAGQRFVTVPIKAYGTLRTGKPFIMEGPVTLHRAADIDGASAEQRRWRISDSALKPRPMPMPSPGTDSDRVVAHYRCADGTAFRVTFDNDRDTATLALPTGPVRLKGQRPASGIWYAADGYDLRGKGDAPTLRRPRAKPLTCTAIH